MSTELKKLAEASLSVLAGLECVFDGGPISSDGHCSVEWHHHCPFCGENWDCHHQVARWDDSFGYSGPEFPDPPEPDSAICRQPDGHIRELLGDLAPVWDVYRQHVDEGVGLPGPDLLLAVANTLDLPLVHVEWEQTESMPGGVGASFFALDIDALLPEIILASARIQVVFDRFQAPATPDGASTERALAVLAWPTCEETGFPIDLEVGYCGDGQRVNRTHTHCPYCGTNDDCPHLFALWCDDFGLSGPNTPLVPAWDAQDIPLVPEAWNVSADWTEVQLREVLGPLQPAFMEYAQLEDGYEDVVRHEIFQGLFALLESDVWWAGWCGDGRGASIGTAYYAANTRTTATELIALTSQLEVAICRLGHLRNSASPGGEKVDR